MSVSARIGVFLKGESAPSIIDGHVKSPAGLEVLVRMEAAGVCHTDLIAAEVFPRPLVLGHEGAGVVIEAGPDVGKVRPGDRVALTFASCGVCPSCRDNSPAYCFSHAELNNSGRTIAGDAAVRLANGEAAFASFFQQSSFAAYALATERNTVKIPDALPFELAAPLGCGVQTGVGAVLNVLKAEAGQSLVVFGAGAVGLSAVMAGRIARCAPVVIVEPEPERRALAVSLGADIALDSADEGLVATIRTLTEGGAHGSVEAAGVPASFRAAIDCLRPKGACAVTAPPARWGEPAPHPGGMALMSTRLLGVIEGDSDPDTFIPELAAWVLSGDLPLDRLVTTYPFEDIACAFEDLRRGAAIKPVLQFGAG